MQVKEVEVSKTFNTGNYTSIKIGLTAEVPPDGDYFKVYNEILFEIDRLFKFKQ